MESLYIIKTPLHPLGLPHQANPLFPLGNTPLKNGVMVYGIVKKRIDLPSSFANLKLTPLKGDF